MFEEYLQDAHEFFRIGEEHRKRSNDREARRYYRASIFYLASAMEAFVNYHANSFAKAGTLSPYETAFLNDKLLQFVPAKMTIVERIEYHKVDDKLRFLLRKFKPNYDFSQPVWSRLMEFKDLRDSLIHPRNVEDNTPISEYRKKIKLGMSAIIQVMNEISKGMFRKPLRKKLLDLMPDVK